MELKLFFLNIKKLDYLHLIKVFFTIAFCIFISQKSFSENLSENKTPKKTAATSAKIQGLLLYADNFYRDSEQEVVEVEGHVQVIYEDKHLKCDKAKIFLRGKKVEAQGQVLLVTQKSTISGDRIIYDYEGDTALIDNGYVQAGQVIFEGSLIQKIGENEYLADDARYTTCTTCPEAWSFSGKRIRAELGGYAYIKSSLLKFGNIPIFWMPYLIVPLKSDRQTGLLTPELETTDSEGITFSQSLFWAMGRSHDSTWTLRNYEYKGLKGLVNYRYVLSPLSSGEIDGAIMEDRLFSNEDRLNLFRNQNSKGDIVKRWYLKYHHYHNLPDGYTHRVDLNNISDLQYSKDYPKESGGNGLPAMENRTSITKNFEDYHFSVDGSYYKNLLQSDPLSQNKFAVHRLPEIQMSQKYKRFFNSGFLYNFDFNYVNFNRPFQSYDDLNASYSPTGSNDRHLNSNGPSTDCLTSDHEKNPSCYLTPDGQFNSDKDLLRTGQRFDFQPTLVYPIDFDIVNILPKISYRETHYLFNAGEERNNIRQYIRTEVSARSRFSKIFGDFSSQQGTRYKHEIQPEVTFTHIPWIYHPSHPFFGSIRESEIPYFSQTSLSDSDLNSAYGIQFDYNDRIFDRKLVTFALINKFIQKKYIQGEPKYKQFLTWKLAQSYDLYQAENNPNNNQPYSDLSSELTLDLDYISLFQKANYFPYQQVTKTDTRVTFTNPKGESLQLGYIQDYNITPGKEVDRNLRTEDYSVTLVKTSKIVNFVSKFIYDGNPQQNSPSLKSWGYGLQIKFPGDCWYMSFVRSQAQNLKAGNNFSFFFIWDGESKPPPPAAMFEKFNF